MSRKTVKVAVIGSGLAGLTTAYLVAEQSKDHDVHFDIHVFEKTSTLGMDASSISLPIPGDEKNREWRVDVPMRSFQGGYYTQLIALYKKLGVSFRPRNFAYCFALVSPALPTVTRRITGAIIYNGASGKAGVGMPSKMSDIWRQNKHGLFTRLILRVWALGLFSLVTLQLVACYLRLLILSVPMFRATKHRNLTYAAWSKATTPTGRLARWTMFDVAWQDFTSFILFRTFTAVCTAPDKETLEHPIDEFLDYVWLTLGSDHYVVNHGVRDVVQRLSAHTPPQNIHLSTPISSITQDAQHPHLVSVKSGSHVFEGFSHVVLATEAIHAAPILESYRDALGTASPSHNQFIGEQIDCLRKFSYIPTIVINHTDDTLLPDNVADRRELNFMALDPRFRHNPDPSELDDSSTYKGPETYTMATQILPRPKGYPDHLPPVYQTTNPIVSPKPGRILSVSRLLRAIVTLESKVALQDLIKETGIKWWQTAGQGEARLGRLQGRAHDADPSFWLCGSYAYSGIPLLEGCVVSARTIVEQGILASEGIKVTRQPW